MLLFGKRIVKANEIARTMHIEMIEEIESSVNLSKQPRALELVKELRELKNKLQDQKSTKSKLICYTDARIIRYLDDIKADVEKGYYLAAEERAKKLNEAIEGRGSVARKESTTSLSKKEDKYREAARKRLQKAGKKAKTYVKPEAIKFKGVDVYTKEEAYNIMLAGLKDERNTIEDKIVEIKARAKNADNKKELELQTKVLNIRNKEIEKFQDDKNREIVIKALEDANETHFEYAIKRSEESVAKIVSEFTDNYEKDEETKNVDKMLDAVTGVSSSSREEAGTVSFDTYEVEQAIEELEQKADEVAERVKEIGQTMSEIGKKAIAVKEKYDDADKAGKRSISTDLDNLMSKYYSAQQEQDIQRNIHATLINKLNVERNLLNAIKGQADIEEINRIIGSNNGGKVENIQEAIEYLNKTLAENREAAEAISGIGVDTKGGLITKGGVGEDLQSDKKKYDQFIADVKGETLADGGNE